jgi:hypothetical protein
MANEYHFDYSKAKPNRFAPNHNRGVVSHGQSNPNGQSNPYGQSNPSDEASSSQKSSQSGKTQESSSRIKPIDPADTTFARFDGYPPKGS